MCVVKYCFNYLCLTNENNSIFTMILSFPVYRSLSNNLIPYIKYKIFYNIYKGLIYKSYP